MSVIPLIKKDIDRKIVEHLLNFKEYKDRELLMSKFIDDLDLIFEKHNLDSVHKHKILYYLFSVYLFQKSKDEHSTIIYWRDKDEWEVK